MEKEFRDYYNALKASNLKVKKEELLISVKDMYKKMFALCKMEEAYTRAFFMDEVQSLTKENMSDDDLCLALMIYIENTKNALGTYLEKKENA